MGTFDVSKVYQYSDPYYKTKGKAYINKYVFGRE